MKSSFCGILMVGFFMNSLCVYGIADTTKLKKKESTHWRSTARINTKGFFNLTGKLVSDNPTFDVNFYYDRKNWGLLIFKAADLYDHQTAYNFLLTAAYKNFKLSKKVTVTPYVGTLFEQSEGFADHGSDIASFLITTVKLNSNLTLEEMSLFANLIVAPEERDWANRFRLTYTGKHWDVISTAWWNNQVFDQSSYWTGSVNIAYSRIKIKEHLFLSIGATGITTLSTSDRVINPSKQSLMFTIAATMAH